MNEIQVLDCTLRDGGYCNQWEFGNKNIKMISQSLTDACVDIIECGFLTNKVNYNKEISKYTKVEKVAEVIPQNRNGKSFVVMMNYGEYNVNELPDFDGTSIDGIRIAFHKKDVEKALEICEAVKRKGYKVFVQAMVSLSYTDTEFLDLIQKVNKIEPYAFYIVDSFGMMKKKNLIHLFYMVENNLKESIQIGFHSHNNMQLAYSNAQALVDLPTNRSLIIDSSIYGMGRGAGNLNTELLVGYLNENVGTKYDIKPLLNVIDEVLNRFYQQNYWGYSLPNYISASHEIHPNYANYLSERNTLTIEAMDEIFSLMSPEKKVSYDRAYIEKLYLEYMETGNIQEVHKAELQSQLKDKTVILIGPGQSSFIEKERIQEFVQNNEVVTISVNFEYEEIDVDYIFLSNLRRFKMLQECSKRKCIVTSNIPADKVYLQTKYYELLNNVDMVRDNAGMMAIRFLIQFGVKEIYLAGFDGYSHDMSENYAEQSMAFLTQNAVYDAMNRGMCEVINQLRKEIIIKFLTTEKYVR